ncbi:MAG TPA: energy transducer TonB [Bacteroidia bacterium]|jgi:TonB family protein|uniref:energy transducer TonB n=1 Tax=Candidatus Pollutiaquabacter sp. TaxID=3416354 RepID=UPI001A4CCC8E|nr:energy transducer TonB [Bacteroidota bacterium]MBL7947989.1 energy transducer TonB [Bacteroidia bacterium]HPD55018.1 energy transducer TonB [Bacteroidia bacterium]HRI42297.1 energy transducer TonB [Bacteroidia bacterium]
MKKVILLCSSLLLISAVFAQEPSQRVKAGFGTKVTQVKPEYPGGPDSLTSFLTNNLAYPAQAKTERIQGRVYIAFLIDRNGKLQNVRLLSGVHPLLDEEALRVVRSMPDWKPGTVAGKPTDVQYILPIDFIIPKPESKD